MSLLKATKFKSNEQNTYEASKQQFLDVIATSGGNFIKKDLEYLVLIYCNMSARYVSDIATTLTEPDGVKTTMTFMNSYIAEIANKLQVPYFHPEEGYSIIDKALQVVLDNGEYTTKVDFITDIITELVSAKNAMESDVETEEA